MSTQEEVRWVLVSGLSTVRLPKEVRLAAQAVGRALARNGYGLVVGRFNGVDRAVPAAFAKELKSMDRPLKDYLIQVVVDKKKPVFKGGNIVRVKEGKQWNEAVIQAEFAVLLGGRGSFITYLFALHQERAVFPFAGTGGDAREAYNDILERWKRNPIKGVERDEFRKKLGGAISSLEDAELIADNLIGLLGQNFKSRNASSSAPSKSIFISYSHEDEKWLEKLQVHLRPMSRDMGVEIKYDQGILQAGKPWHEVIQEALRTSSIVIFLVSPHFIDSEYIREHELRPMLEAAKEEGVIVSWIYLDHSRHDRTGLDKLQALHDIQKPLSDLNASGKQKALVEITKKIEELL